MVNSETSDLLVHVSRTRGVVASHEQPQGHS